MDIFLLRHGDAGKGGGAEDPLSTGGRVQIDGAAAALAVLQARIAAILTSPLVRARQTAEIVAKALGLDKALRVDERLAPGFGKGQLRKVLEEHAREPGILLVGHEPDFSRAIAACTGGVRVECRKGSLARIIMEDVPSLAGTLAWLIPPEAFRT